MMKKLDSVIQFLFDNRADSRVKMSKVMKYGFRHYYLSFEIDSEEKTFYGKTIHISFDNRNSCVEVHADHNEVIEDTELLNKWSDIIEEYLSDGIEDRAISMIEKSLSDCNKKDIYREYQMIKILDEE